MPCPVGDSNMRYDIVVSSQYWFSLVISNTRSAHCLASAMLLTMLVGRRAPKHPTSMLGSADPASTVSVSQRSHWQPVAAVTALRRHATHSNCSTVTML